MKLHKHHEHDIYTIVATPDQQRKLIQHIVCANGSPAICPVIIDSTVYWHVTSLHRAGINPEEFA